MTDPTLVSQQQPNNSGSLSHQLKSSSRFDQRPRDHHPTSLDETKNLESRTTNDHNRFNKKRPSSSNSSRMETSRSGSPSRKKETTTTTTGPSQHDTSHQPDSAKDDISAVHAKGSSSNRIDYRCKRPRSKSVDGHNHNNRERYYQRQQDTHENRQTTDHNRCARRSRSRDLKRTKACVISEDYSCCASICTRLNGIKNTEPFGKREKMAKLFIDEMVDEEEFVFENTEGRRFGAKTFEDRAIIGRDHDNKRSIQVTHRVFVAKDRSSSYCYELEWDSKNKEGVVALYGSYEGKLIRCFLFEGSPDQKNVNFDDIKQTRSWFTSHKYLLKKGLTPSSICYYTNYSTGTTQEEPLNEL